MSPRKTYILKLYVAGNTPNSMRAVKTLRNILETEFRGVYAIKVIDVLKNPQLAEEDKIIALNEINIDEPPKSSQVKKILSDIGASKALVVLSKNNEQLNKASKNLKECDVLTIK